MDYFPAFLNLRDRACLLVGGGDIALRKARLLSDAGARLTVVAPDIESDLRELATEKDFILRERVFCDDDIDGQWLVVSATADADVASHVFDVANANGVYCNSVDEQTLCSFITPAIVDRGPIVVGISSSGTAPVLARMLREQIERLLPTGLEALATIAGRWRDRVQAEISTLAGRRSFWEKVFSGRAATFAIQGDSESAERAIGDALRGEEAGSQGEAWLVGAGPGDPGLLTLRALQVLQKVDVIVHDRLVSKEVLALARRDADRISVGKTPGCRVNSQDEINALLVKLVASGKRVCRLKGGDPFVFGRGGEEAQALSDNGLAWQVVPGITAAAGCAAAAGIPLTHRGLSTSVALITAHGRDSVDRLDWPSLARDRQTLAFYMAVGNFAELSNKLVANGKSVNTPIAIVENGTLPEQQVYRGALGQLAMLAEAHKIKAPAMLIVGEVAAIAETGADTASRSLSTPICAKKSSTISEQGKQNDLRQYS